jgi:hypothetical protein
MKIKHVAARVEKRLGKFVSEKSEFSAGQDRRLCF